MIPDEYERLRHLPRSEWSVVIHDHHPGFIDWATFEANQLRLAQNTHPRVRTRLEER